VTGGWYDAASDLLLLLLLLFYPSFVSPGLLMAVM
jgi:hypothetical protein